MVSSLCPIFHIQYKKSNFFLIGFFFFNIFLVPCFNIEIRDIIQNILIYNRADQKNNNFLWSLVAPKHYDQKYIFPLKKLLVLCIEYILYFLNQY